MSGAHQELWKFSVGLYSAPGVGDACLLLQDESGVDVPVLLFSAWLSRSGVALSEGQVARIDEVVKAWRHDVVQPLRAIRRRLKTGPHPAPTEETENLRNGVKRIELHAEKIELAMLEAEGAALISTGGSAADASGNMLTVLRHYHGSEPDMRARKAVAAITRALAAF